MNHKGFIDCDRTRFARHTLPLALLFLILSASSGAGASNNHGLGMWSHELSAGATVYLDEKKQWHAATDASYNIQSQIRGTNRKAGKVLSLEGGVGHTFCSGLCNVGVDYYTQWKVTDDKFANVTPNFLGKHRYYGIGPEVNGVIPINAKTLAVFKVAYFREFKPGRDSGPVDHHVGDIGETETMT